MSNTVKILAVPGSLRPGSSNHFILQFIASSGFPQDIQYNIYDGIGNLPHFNPALDTHEAPQAVAYWRGALNAADAVIICSPEYAFGVPGSLKNAFDWTVSSGSFNEKPVAVITASSSGQKAHAALLNIFAALGATAVPEASLLIQFVRTKVNKEGKVTDDATRHALITVCNALLKEVMAKKGEG